MNFDSYENTYSVASEFWFLSGWLLWSGSFKWIKKKKYSVTNEANNSYETVRFRESKA